MKIVFFLIVNLVIFSSQAEVEVDSFQSSLDKFEKYCIDQNDELREDVYIKEEFYSCRDEMNYLQGEFETREELMSSNPDILKQYKDCIENRDKPKVLPFAEQVKEAAEQVACNPAEKEEFEKDCGKAWQCNKYRAIISGAKLLPNMIEKPIVKYVSNTVREQKYSSECIGDGRSNCIEDFITAFLANLWSSASSVWTLVSEGSKSLFNIGGWFDSEADKLQVKAAQSEQDVKDFWDNPGLWFSNMVDDMKKGVDDWVKSSVFCQKWSGRAQFSTCLKPLESYDCIDCDDKINATCIALGAIASEAGIAILTAGVGTAANLTAKAGVRTMAAVATKVSTKIKSVAPSFKASSKSKSSNVAKATAIAAKGISNGTKIAKDYYLITSAKAKRIKEKMDKMALAVSSSKVVVVAQKIVEKGNIPARISEKLGEKGVTLAAKVGSKVGTGALKKEADTIVKLSQKSNRSAKARQVIQDKSHGNGRVVTHTSKSSRLYSRGQRVPDRDTPIRPDRSGSSKDSKNTPEVANERDRRTTLTEENQSNSKDRVTQDHSKKEEQRKLEQSKREDQQRKEQQRITEEKREQQEKKKIEEKRVAEEKRKRDQKAKEEEDERKEKSKKALMAKAVAADLASKGLAKSIEQADKEVEQISKAANGEGEKFEESLSSAKKVLGVEDARSNSAKALEQANAVKEMYSEKNRSEMVSQIQKSNSNLSDAQANQVFNERQSEVNKSYDYMNDLNNQNSRVQTVSSEREELSRELEKVKKERKLASLSSEIQSIKSQREQIENGDSEKGKGNEQVSAVADQTISNQDQLGIPTSSRSESKRSSSRENEGGSSNFSNSTGTSSVASTEVQGDESLEDLHRSSEVPGEVEGEAAELEELAENKEADPEELEEKKGRSKNLRGLLDLLNKKNMKIEHSVAFERDLGLLKASDEEARKRLESLREKVDAGKRAKRKVTYQTSTGSLEIYQFDQEKFTISIDQIGTAELIDNEKSGSILQSSVTPVE